MKILTLGERELRSPQIYGSIKYKHVLISISSSDRDEIVVPPNAHRLSTLFLKFDDIEDIDNRYVYFDRGMAKEVIDFVENYCAQVDLIVVQCEAGLSRSVAIGSALSKILNYTDDDVFTKGIPNMFVYTTLLDYYFSNASHEKDWSKINYRRVQGMSKFLTPAQIKLSRMKNSRRVDT